MIHKNQKNSEDHFFEPDPKARLDSRELRRKAERTKNKEAGEYEEFEKIMRQREEEQKRIADEAFQRERDREERELMEADEVMASIRNL